MRRATRAAVIERATKLLNGRRAEWIHDDHDEALDERIHALAAARDERAMTISE